MDSPNAQTPEAIAGAIASEMPTPTAAAPTAPPKQDHAASVTQPAADAPRDSLGRLFDPEKFAADETGRPKVDSKGRYYSARLGRRSAAAPTAQAPGQSFIPSDPPTNNGPAAPAASTPSAAPIGESQADRFAVLGDVYTRAALAGAMAVFGDEWAPDDKAEYGALRDSVSAYLRATNREDLPPGYALAFAALTYAGKRIPRPKTQTRIAGFVAAAKAWWRGHSVARRVAAMPQPEGAR